MQNAKILVVEDDAMVAKGLEVQLTKLGYEMSGLATTGQEAIQEVVQKIPDLILMDIKLKGNLDGIATALHLQKLHDIPVVYLTAYPDQDTLQRVKQTKPFGCLIKPFSYRELHITIEMALHKHHLEKQTKENEIRYRTMFDGVPVGLYRTTPQGEIVDINLAMAQMLGYSGKEELLAVNVVDTFFDPEIRQQWQDWIQHENVGRGFEMQIRRKDGSVIWVEDNARVVQNEAGQVCYYEGSIKDITEQKQAEIALRDSLKTSVDIVQAIPSGLFIYQYEPPDQLILLNGNPAAAQLTGKNIDEWQGREFNEIWPEAKANGITQAYLDVMKTGTIFESEDLHYADDHIQGAFRVKAFPMPGNRLGVAFENITEQKTAEEALQDNIQELKIAYQQAIIYAQELTGEITERRRADAEIRKLNEELEQRVADRTRDLSVLYEVTMVASESMDLETMLQRLLDQVLTMINRDIGVIFLLDEEEKHLKPVAIQGITKDVESLFDPIASDNELAGWIIDQGESLLIPDLARDPRIYRAKQNPDIALAFLGLPMRATGRVVGVLGIIGKKEHQFNAEEVALLATVADQVGVAVENARLRQQAEHAAVIEERERLARELHDSVTQSLYSLSLFAEAGENLIDNKDFKAAKHNLHRMGETAQQALKEMRLLVYELRPLDLEKEGLIGALHQRLSAVEGRVNITARLVTDELVELPAPVEEELYRIAQEALNNALKHAAATTVSVHLRTEDELVELEVVDDGAGFDPDVAGKSGGMGLLSMRERSKKLGGVLEIHSTPGSGTSIKVCVKTAQFI